MVMSAGQRTYLMSRNNGINEELRKAGEKFDDVASEEQLNDEEYHKDYDSADYMTKQFYEKVRKQSAAPVRKRVKSRIKRPKLKSRMEPVSTVEPKLNNYYEENFS